MDVTLHALNKTVSGIVVGIVPIADPKTKNIMLKIQLPQLDIAVENMSATVQVPVSAEKQLKMIPRDALVKFQGKDFVYTVKDGKAVIVPVHIVSFVGQFVGVDSPDVADGMSVVVDGNQRLRPDQPVEAVSGNASEKSR
ncbi:MAG: hypothetical protein PHP23_08200 [Desulfobacterales bacterium]|nr:hypothetical protein [Desulfobacterales bacterium]